MGHTGKEKLFKDLSLTLVSYTHVCMGAQMVACCSFIHPTHLHSFGGLMQSRQMQVQWGFVCLMDLQSWDGKIGHCSLLSVSSITYSTVWFNSLYTNFVPGVNSGNMCRTVENFSGSGYLMLTFVSLTTLFSPVFPSMVFFALFLDKWSPTVLHKNWNHCCHAPLHFICDTLGASVYQGLYTRVTHDLCILTWGRSMTSQNKIQWLKAQQIHTRKHIKGSWTGDIVLMVQFAQAEKEREFFYHGKLSW